MTSALSFARGTTLAFAYVFTSAAAAALVVFPFEAIAVPLVPGILLALAMHATARRVSSRARPAREELKELARANVGISAFTLPLCGTEVWLGWSHSSLLLATCALSALAVLHGAVTLVAFHAPPARASLSVHSPCAEC